MLGRRGAAGGRGDHRARVGLVARRGLAKVGGLHVAADRGQAARIAQLLHLRADLLFVIGRGEAAARDRRQRRHARRTRGEGSQQFHDLHSR